jgi:hypothetical protein
VVKAVQETLTVITTPKSPSGVLVGKTPDERKMFFVFFVEKFDAVVEKLLLCFLGLGTAPLVPILTLDVTDLALSDNANHQFPCSKLVEIDQIISLGKGLVVNGMVLSGEIASISRDKTAQNQRCKTPGSIFKSVSLHLVIQSVHAGVINKAIWPEDRHWLLAVPFVLIGIVRMAGQNYKEDRPI